MNIKERVKLVFVVLLLASMNFSSYLEAQDTLALINPNPIDTFLPGERPTTAQDFETNYYIKNGDSVPLSPSNLYGAFLIDQESLVEFNQLVSTVGSLDVERSTLTDKYNIVLVRKQISADSSSFLSAILQLRANTYWYPSYEEGRGDKILVNEFNVQFDRGLDSTTGLDRLAAMGATLIPGKKAERNFYTVEFIGKAPLEALELINALALEPDVSYAIPNFIIVYPREFSIRKPPELQRVKPEVFEPETYEPEVSVSAPAQRNVTAPQQWPDDHYFVTGSQQDLEQTNATAAWEFTTGSCDISVAILDDGVDLLHEDLISKLAHPWDAILENTNPHPDGNDSHGTMVAGVAAASTNNTAIGIAGTVWGGKIIPIKILSSTPTSTITQALVTKNAIDWAVSSGANVINGSWGYGSGISWPEVNTAIDDALAAQTVLVFSVGNCGTCPVEWPANLASTADPALARDLISVGAIDGSGTVLPWSSSGPDITSVSLVAPGVDVRTTDISGPIGSNPTSYTPFFNDTSAAAPFVAGAAALLLSWKPDATPLQIRNWLTTTADAPPPSATSDPAFNAKAYGGGLLNIGKALGAVGTAGIVITGLLDPEKRLSSGEQSTLRVHVTRDGVALSGVSVKFQSQDTSLAIVEPENVIVTTDCSGIAEANVTSTTPSSENKLTYIDAKVQSVTQSIPVRVGSDFGWWWVLLIILLILLIFIFWRR